MHRVAQKGKVVPENVFDSVTRPLALINRCEVLRDYYEVLLNNGAI